MKSGKKAITRYPGLLQNDYINYKSRTATAVINIGGHSYFDKEIVSSQFQRLFQRLECKIDYKSHQIDIFVDHARKHMSCEYNVVSFEKSIGSRYPIQIIDYYVDNNVEQTIDCYFL